MLQVSALAHREIMINWYFGSIHISSDLATLIACNAFLCVHSHSVLPIQCCSVCCFPITFKMHSSKKHILCLKCHTLQPFLISLSIIGDYICCYCSSFKIGSVTIIHAPREIYKTSPVLHMHNPNPTRPMCYVEENAFLLRRG